MRDNEVLIYKNSVNIKVEELRVFLSKIKNNSYMSDWKDNIIHIKVSLHGLVRLTGLEY